MIQSKQKTPSIYKALDNKKAVVKVGAGSEQRAQQMSRMWNGQDVQRQCYAKKGE